MGRKESREGREKIVKIFAGVDPGRTGGMAVLKESGELFWPLLSFQDASLHDIAKMFEDLSIAKEDLFCFLENVHAFPGQGVVGMFKFGQIYGMLEALIVANKIKYERVEPRTWQKALGIQPRGDKKQREHKLGLKSRAQQLFPSCSGINMETADSLLIAEHCRRTKR